MNSDSVISSWSPTKLWEPLQIWTVTMSIIKIAISRVASDWEVPNFNYGMDDLGLYARIILFSFIISIPFGIFRRKHMQLLTFLCADIVLACNIFIKAGYVVGIVAVFLMLMTTVALKLIYNRRQKLFSVPFKGKLQYCCYLLVWGVIAYVITDGVHILKYLNN